MKHLRNATGLALLVCVVSGVIFGPNERVQIDCALIAIIVYILWATKE